MIKSPFFWLACATFIGTVGQLGAIVLWALWWCIYLLKPQIDHEMAANLRRLGLLFIVTWLIFPVFDVINNLLPISEFIQSHAKQTIKFVVDKSQLPSGWLVTGLGLYLLSWIGTKNLSKTYLLQDRKIILNFFRGIAVFLGIFGVFFLAQHFFGIDYRGPNYKLKPENLLSSGNYRIFGFYGHTLHFSSVMMAWSVLAGYLLAFKADFLQPIKKYFWFIFVVSFLFLVLSGGRTAIAVGIVFNIVLISRYCYKQTWFSWSKFSLIISSFLALIFGVLYKVGILTRLQNGIQGMKTAGIDYEFARIEFWKVYWQMIQDAPLLGHGAGRIREFVKDAYYYGMGYEGLTQKYNAHNLYLEILANIGLIGFVVLLFMFFKMYQIWQKLHANNVKCQFLPTAMLLAIFANGFHALTQNVLFDANVTNMYLIVFWVLIWNIVEENRPLKN